MVVFELRDSTLPVSGTGVLGLWSATAAAPAPTRAPTPAATASSMSFATPGSFDVPEATSEPVLWRIDVAPDRNAAQAQLTRHLDRLAASRTAVENAAQRLFQMGSLTAPAASSGLQPSFGVPFGAGLPVAAPLPPPERELLALLATLGQPTPSFALPGALGAGLDEAMAQWHEFLARLRQAVSHFAQVDTRAGGRLLGRTTVTWMGDMATICAPQLDHQEVKLHERALALALGSRDALLRTFVVVVQGATDIALRLALPGGPLLALPAVWRFVRQVLELQHRFQES